MLGFLVTAAQIVELISTISCPSAAAVEAHLRSMLPAFETSTGGDRASLLPIDGGLRLTLDSRSGERLAERVLRDSGSCEDLARATAVIILAFEADLHPMPGRDPTIAGPPTPRATPTGSPTHDTAVARPAPRSQPRVTPRFELAAAFLSSVTGSDFAPGGSVAAIVAPPRFNLAARIALGATGTRDQPLAVGHARWTRATLGVGPLYRFRRARLLIDLHAQLLGALLYLEGTGLSTTRESYAFDVGLGVGARLGVRIGPVAPFVGVGLDGWLREHELHVTGIAGSATVPRLEALFTAGVAFGNFL